MTSTSTRCRPLRPAAVGLLLPLLLAAASFAEPPADQAAARADTLLSVIDTVLARHIDPPTEQALLVAGVKKMLAAAGAGRPVGLGRDVSQLHDRAATRQFVAEMIRRARATGRAQPDQLRQAFIEGALASAPGFTGLISREDHHVQQLLIDNRYVGIGIALGQKDGFPAMIQVFPLGPAKRAGAKAGDLMISIDGIDARGMELRRVIELLRGQEGKLATVVVRQPDESETRTLEMVRGVVHFESVMGVKRIADDRWEYGLEQEPPIAYVKLASIRGSTPLELRQAAGRLHAQGFAALVLDFRGTQPGDVRHAVMVADLLLGAGPIGQLTRPDGKQEFHSNADQLFPDWPLAVLIDASTSGQIEWLAAALRDNGRATLVGAPTAGFPFHHELVELPGGLGAATLPVALLHRGDGQLLAPLDAPRAPAHVPLVVAAPDGTPQFMPRRRMPPRGGLTPDQAAAAPIPEATRVLAEQLAKAAATATAG